jgi:dTDP-4-dehydrorhamnose 3,5-epimerase
MSFTFTRHSQIPAIILIDGVKNGDERGYFMESFRADEFLSFGIPRFVQENHSHSISNTLRGLHYQLEPKAQGKLVRCVYGSVLDIVVDIRLGSPTYGQHVSIPLGSSARMVYIPPGFAHGLVVDDFYPYCAEIVYRATEYFCPELDRGIRWNDPDLNISWGLMSGAFDKLKISEKDRNAPLLKDADNNFIWIG